MWDSAPRACGLHPDAEPRMRAVDALHRGTRGWGTARGRAPDAGLEEGGAPGCGRVAEAARQPTGRLVYTCVRARGSCLFSRKFLAVGEWTVIGLGVRPQRPRGDEKELEL